MSVPIPPAPGSPAHTFEKLRMQALQEEFRKKFNEEAFSLSYDQFGVQIHSPKRGKTSGLYTQTEWNDIVRTVEKWDQKTIHGVPRGQWHTRHQEGYRWAKMYTTYKNNAGEKFLAKIPKDESLHVGQQLVAHQMKVFDILHGYHSQGHKGPTNLNMHVKDTWCNISFELCKLFCQMCPICSLQKGKKKKFQGAVKPILSHKFRDRFQADLIDYRSDAAPMDPDDPFNPVKYRWLLVVKDHFTRLIHLTALRKKQAKEVASALDHYFSFIGYPLIFQTDNGTEFQAEVLQILKEHNPRCTLITGRPRTPRDQGSVERANQGIKNTISKMVVDQKNRCKTDKQKASVTWVTVLGVTMRCVNTNRVRGRDQVEPYEMVFGTKFDEPMYAAVAEQIALEDATSSTVEKRARRCGPEFQDKMKMLGELGEHKETDNFLKDPVLESIGNCYTDMNPPNEGQDLPHGAIDPYPSNQNEVATRPQEVPTRPPNRELFASPAEAPATRAPFVPSDTEDDSIEESIARGPVFSKKRNHVTIGGTSASTKKVKVSKEASFPVTPSSFQLGKVNHPKKSHASSQDKTTFSPFGSSQKREDTKTFSPFSSSKSESEDVTGFDSPSTTEISSPWSKVSIKNLLKEQELSSPEKELSSEEMKTPLPVQAIVKSEPQELPSNPRSTPMTPQVALQRKNASGEATPYVNCRNACSICNPEGNFQTIPYFEDEFYEKYSKGTEWWPFHLVQGFVSLVYHKTHPGDLYLAHLPMTDNGRFNIDPSPVALPCNKTTIVFLIFTGSHYCFCKIELKKKIVTVYDGLKYKLETYYEHILFALKKYAEVPPSSRSKNVLHNDQNKRQSTYLSKSALKNQENPWKVRHDPHTKQLDGHNCGPIACSKSLLEILGMPDPPTGRAEIITLYQELHKEADLSVIPQVAFVDLHSERKQEDFINLLDDADEAPTQVDMDKTRSEYTQQIRESKNEREKIGRKRQDRQAAKMKKMYREKNQVHLGDCVTLGLDKRERSRCNALGLQGIVFAVSKSCGIKIVTQNGILCKVGKGDYWVSPEKWNKKNLAVLPDVLEELRERILKGKFREDSYPKLTIKEAHSQQFGHKFLGSLKCTCKKGCKGSCKCVKAGYLCTSACFCGGQCHHSEVLSGEKLPGGT